MRRGVGVVEVVEGAILLFVTFSCQYKLKILEDRNMIHEILGSVVGGVGASLEKVKSWWRGQAEGGGRAEPKTILPLDGVVRGEELSGLEKRGSARGNEYDRAQSPVLHG